jgi:hypothetical protein
MSEYYVNELSFEGQFIVDPVRQFEREIALLTVVNDLLIQRGIELLLNRAVLQRPVSILNNGKAVNCTVQDIIEKVDHGISAFFWEKIGNWPYPAINDEFEGVRVFFAGTDISNFGAARPAVHLYLDQLSKKRLFSSAISDTCSGNPLDFGILENGQSKPITVSVTNLTSKDAVITDIGGVVVLPNNWGEAIDYYEEKYQYIRFTGDLRQQMVAGVWISNLFAQVDGKLSRLNEIVDTIVQLRRARKMKDSSLINELNNRYNEQYQDMFVHKSSSFSDESDTRKNQLGNSFKFSISDGRIDFCPFHTKFAYKEFRLYFTWPIPVIDCSTYIAYLGQKIL